MEAPQLVRALQGVGQCALVDLRSLVQRKPVVALRSCPAYCGAVVVALGRGSDSRRTVSWRRRLLRSVTASSQGSQPSSSRSLVRRAHTVLTRHTHGKSTDNMPTWRAWELWEKAQRSTLRHVYFCF